MKAAVLSLLVLFIILIGSGVAERKYLQKLSEETVASGAQLQARLASTELTWDQPINRVGPPSCKKISLGRFYEYQTCFDGVSQHPVQRYSYRYTAPRPLISVGRIFLISDGAFFGSLEANSKTIAFIYPDGTWERIERPNENNHFLPPTRAGGNSVVVEKGYWENDT